MKCIKCKVNNRITEYRYCVDCLSLASQLLEDYEDIATIIERNEYEKMSESSSDPDEESDDYYSDGVYS